MNQTAMVFEYMQQHGAIDPMTALRELGIMRLGARIFELKAAGIPVVDEFKTNGRKRWKEYRLG